MRDVLLEVNEIFHEEGGGSNNGGDYLRKMMTTMMKKAWAVLSWDFHDQVQLQGASKTLAHEHTSRRLCTQVML